MRILWAVALWGVCAQAAAADDATQRAREHYQRGTKLYDLQRYVEAAHEYEQAYELKDEPALLFNIGQAYRLGGDVQRAIGAYRSYLRRVPDSPNREPTLALIEDLKKALETQKKPPTGTLPGDGKAADESRPAVAQPGATVAPSPAPAAAKDTPTPPPAVTHRKLQYAGIGIGVAGIALVAVGGAFAGLTAGIDHDLNHPQPGTPFDKDLESRGRSYQAASIAMFAVGGAAVITGAALIAVGATRARRLALVPGPGALGLALAGSFR
jgi:tetratricopeptide (TPR) repeat protein